MKEGQIPSGTCCYIRNYGPKYNGRRVQVIKWEYPYYTTTMGNCERVGRTNPTFGVFLPRELEPIEAGK